MSYSSHASSCLLAVFGTSWKARHSDRICLSAHRGLGRQVHSDTQFRGHTNSPPCRTLARRGARSGSPSLLRDMVGDRRWRGWRAVAEQSGHNTRTTAYPPSLQSSLPVAQRFVATARVFEKPTKESCAIGAAGEDTDNSAGADIVCWRQQRHRIVTISTAGGQPVAETVPHSDGIPPAHETSNPRTSFQWARGGSSSRGASGRGANAAPAAADPPCRSLSIPGDRETFFSRGQQPLAVLTPFGLLPSSLELPQPALAARHRALARSRQTAHARSLGPPRTRHAVWPTASSRRDTPGAICRSCGAS